MTGLASIEHALSLRRFSFLLGALLLVSFPEVFLGGATFYYRDFGIYSYPLAHYQRECFWAGELPFWNPYNNLGIPFLAQWNTMSLYPPALFYLLLPLSWSLGVFCLLHLFLAGLTMYGLVAHWTKNRLAAGVAGVIFAYNGFTWHALMWTSITAALAWMPLVVLLSERAAREGGRWILYATLVGALQMLTGAAELILLTWIIVGLLEMAGASPGGNLPRLGRRLGRLGLVVVLVAGLSAAQLIPFLELLNQSQRSASSIDSEWAIPALGWANLFVPLFHCFRSFQGVFVQPGQYWTTSYYLGIGALLLAIWSLCVVRQRRVWLLGGLASVSLLLAMGEHTPLYGWLAYSVPGLGFMRFPVKFVMVLVFTVPILAGYGMTRLGGRDAASPRLPLWVLGLGCGLMVAGILWMARTMPARGSDWAATWRCGGLRLVFLSLVLAVVLWFNRRPGVKFNLLGTIGLLVLLWADVRTHAPNLQPTVSRSVYEPGWVARELKLAGPVELGRARMMVSPGALALLRHRAAETAEVDYVGRRLALFANCNLLDNLPKVNGFFPLTLPPTDEIIWALHDQPEGLASPLAEFLGVAQATSSVSPTDWQPRPGARPLLSAGARPVFAEDTVSLQELVKPGFKPAEIVYLPPSARLALAGVRGGTGTILSTRVERHRLRARVRGEAPFLVTMAQSTYPGWRAQVDGAEVKLHRANVAFHAFQVPAGEHEVDISYRATSFTRGACISLVTLLGMCGVAGASWRLAPGSRAGKRLRPLDLPRVTLPIQEVPKMMGRGE